MKPIAPKTLPVEIRVERGVLKKAGSLLSGGGKRRFLLLSDAPTDDPALAPTLGSLQKAGHTVVRAADQDRSPAVVDAILAVGNDEQIGAAVRVAESGYPDLPCVLVPSTREAQFDFPFCNAPSLVLCDPSLPASDADRKRATVELIRYALGFDPSLFDLLYTDFDFGALLRRCLTIRCDLLDADKTDLFDRLGTVIGRAVGRATDGETDPAEQLAIGLAAATRYALKIGYCRRDFLPDLVGLLTYHGLPNSALVSDDELIAAIKDTPWADGRNVISLPRRLGECGLIEFDPADLTGLLPN
ncbi:MAG: hypothetical protein IKP74_04330 [Clostridia bacterium]|nr:hypothetical protein [Clostridia bacterium]